MLTVLLKHN